MNKILLLSGDSLPEKRLLRALELELTERGASITLDPRENADVVAVVPDPEEVFALDTLIESGRTVFYCHYENAELPDGVVSIIRPFSLERFAEALLQNVSEGESVAVRTAELSLVGEVLTYGGEIIDLSQTEMLLFSILYENRGRPVSRESLHKTVWGVGDSNVLDVYVSYLRKKLDHRFGKQFILTVRGKGYMLK